MSRTLEENRLDWHVDEVREQAIVSATLDGTTTLQLPWYRLLSSHVIRAMHEQVQLCSDPPREFALILESLGVSRVNQHSASTENLARRWFRQGVR